MPYRGNKGQQNPPRGRRPFYDTGFEPNAPSLMCWTCHRTTTSRAKMTVIYVDGAPRWRCLEHTTTREVIESSIRHLSTAKKEQLLAALLQLQEDETA